MIEKMSDSSSMETENGKEDLRKEITRATPLYMDAAGDVWTEPPSDKPYEEFTIDEGAAIVNNNNCEKGVEIQDDGMVRVWFIDFDAVHEEEEVISLKEWLEDQELRLVE